MQGDSKICVTCEIQKPIEAFGPARSCVGGRSHACKECRNKYLRQYRAQLSAERNSLMSLKAVRRPKRPKNLVPMSYTADGLPVLIAGAANVALNKQEVAS